MQIQAAMSQTPDYAGLLGRTGIDAGQNLAAAGNDEVREKFDTFVGEVFYGEMIKAMRKTTDKPAYLHGGQAEEIFRGQYDQMLAQHLTEATASQFTEPMYNLFMLTRG